MKGLPPEHTTSRACVILNLLLLTMVVRSCEDAALSRLFATAARSEGTAPHSLLSCTTLPTCSTVAAPTAAATFAAAATTADQGVDRTPTRARSTLRDDESLESADTFTFMPVQHTAGVPVNYYSRTGLAPVIHAERGDAATAAAAGWQWQQPHQRSERPCRDCLSGGVSGGLSTSSLRVAGGRQRQLWSQRSEPTECPCLDSLFGGESGGRAIGSTR